MVTLPASVHSSWVGRTGSGKTHTYREAVYLRSTLRRVFFNTQRVGGFGPSVSRWDPALLSRPGASVNLVGPRPSTDDAERGRMLDLLARVVDDLFSIGDTALQRGHPERTPAVRLGIDEVHLFAPKGSHGPADLVATNGHHYGITGDFIAQRPALTSHTVLSQAVCHVVFDMDEYEQAYLDDYGVPLEVRAWISDTPAGAAPGTPSHRFAVRVGKTWRTCRAWGS